MNTTSEQSSSLKIAAWVALGLCVIFFILGWTTNAAGWSVVFYLSLTTGLVLLYVDYRNGKKRSFSQPSIVQAAHPAPPDKATPRVAPAPTVFNPSPVVKSAPEPKPAQAGQHLTPGQTEQPVPKPPPNLINNRYAMIEKEYKKGGMAIISLAKDYQNQQKKVIIKSPRPDTDHSMQLNIEKLSQEGEYLRKASHPNIVKFIDLFPDRDKKLNLVVEYIEGGDLLNKFKYSPADEKRAIKWGSQLLNALEYIHRSGFIHRDLNPGNIMVAGNDDITLIDFGTIKGSGFSSDTVFFKPGFEIPEVAAQAYADERSDIYGAGSTLFFLLTSERPKFIRGRDVVRLLVDRGISSRTSKCVAQALQMDPNFRFQTAAAMRRALLGE